MKDKIKNISITEYRQFMQVEREGSVISGGHCDGG